MTALFPTIVVVDSLQDTDTMFTLTVDLILITSEQEIGIIHPTQEDLADEAEAVLVLAPAPVRAAAEPDVVKRTHTVKQNNYNSIVRE